MSQPDRFTLLIDALQRNGARFVVMGVWGANYYARSAGHIFLTEDRDLFLPPDPHNALMAWQVCEDSGLRLSCGDEPLGRPLDDVLARQVVERRALVRAETEDIVVDLSLVMAGFDFDEVWGGRRLFRVGTVDIPVARLAHIVASKAAAARPKDHLFLATHEDALRQMGRRRGGKAPR